MSLRRSLRLVCRRLLPVVLLAVACLQPGHIVAHMDTDAGHQHFSFATGLSAYTEHSNSAAHDESSICGQCQAGFQSAVPSELSPLLSTQTRIRPTSNAVVDIASRRLRVTGNRDPPTLLKSH